MSSSNLHSEFFKFYFTGIFKYNSTLVRFIVKNGQILHIILWSHSAYSLKIMNKMRLVIISQVLCKPCKRFAAAFHCQNCTVNPQKAEINFHAHSNGLMKQPVEMPFTIAGPLCKIPHGGDCRSSLRAAEQPVQKLVSL